MDRFFYFIIPSLIFEYKNARNCGCLLKDALTIQLNSKMYPLILKSGGDMFEGKLVSRCTCGKFILLNELLHKGVWTDLSQVLEPSIIEQNPIGTVNETYWAYL